MQESGKGLVNQIEDLLPQTQCTKCGFDGCRPYAEAIAQGEAAINRCPPGGESGIAALAELLNVPVLPLDTSRGQPGPVHVAWIDEQHCIGCTICIQACPVDAIVGANKRMHTVIPDLCTGCELCVAPCPVDCIAMQPATPTRYWTRADAKLARQRFEQRNQRLREEAERAFRLSPQPVSRADAKTSHDDPANTTAASPQNANATTPAVPTPVIAEHRRRAAIEAALARARARRAGVR